MAGAYCRYCDQRCFVYRVIPDGPQKGWAGHLATCRRGMEHDRRETGHDHTTAINPATAVVTAPETSPAGRAMTSPRPAGDPGPGHPFAAVLAGTVDTRHRVDDGDITDYLRQKGARA